MVVSRAKGSSGSWEMVVFLVAWIWACLHIVGHRHQPPSPSKANAIVKCAVTAIFAVTFVVVIVVVVVFSLCLSFLVSLFSLLIHSCALCSPEAFPLNLNKDCN